MGAINLPNAFLTLFMIFTISKESQAISCYVCHSVNGSNPECERDLVESDRWANGRGSLLQKNCRSSVGATDVRNPQRADHCVTILGEYEDPKTREHVPVVVRDCTAAIPDWSRSRNVRCEQHIPLEGYVHYTDNKKDKLYNDMIRHVDGCMEVCSENQCNGRALPHLGLRYREAYRSYYEDRRYLSRESVRFSPLFSYYEATPSPTGSRLVYLYTIRSGAEVYGVSVTAMFAMFMGLLARI